MSFGSKPRSDSIGLYVKVNRPEKADVETEVSAIYLFFDLYISAETKSVYFRTNAKNNLMRFAPRCVEGWSRILT